MDRRRRRYTQIIGDRRAIAYLPEQIVNERSTASSHLVSQEIIFQIKPLQSVSRSHHETSYIQDTTVRSSAMMGVQIHGQVQPWIRKFVTFSHPRRISPPWKPSDDSFSPRLSCVYLDVLHNRRRRSRRCLLGFCLPDLLQVVALPFGYHSHDNGGVSSTVRVHR